MPTRTSSPQSSRHAVVKPRVQNKPRPAPATAPTQPLQRRCACGGRCPSCASKREDKLQPRLEINEPGDAYELEAEGMAERVVAAAGGGLPEAPPQPPSDAPAGNGTPAAPNAPPEAPAAPPATAGSSASAPAPPAPPPSHPTPNASVRLRIDRCIAHRKCACGGSCSRCRDEEPKRAQRSGGSVAPAQGESVDEAALLPETLGSGAALDATVRGFVDRQFGADFSGVRIHDGARAATAAAAIGAQAYTVGRDIVFGTGRYAPRTRAGLHLLAHELTHVVQQGAVQTNATVPTVPTATAAAPAQTRRLQRQSAAEDGCPPTPTGLGHTTPDPPCTTQPTRDIGESGTHFHFCPDSDRLTETDAGEVAGFVQAQETDAQYLVHGYASVDGGASYNRALACHRANAMAAQLRDAGVADADVAEIAGKGPTAEFGSAADNRVAVVLAEVPAERRFGRTREDPACPPTPTGLGEVNPSPACPEDGLDLGQTCMAMAAPDRADQCDSYHFCLDSDVFAYSDTPRSVMKFVRKQAATATYLVHGYASDEGPHNRTYNFRLACHRAKRVAREMMKYGVPPERINIASKGPTSQFPGGPEFNRVAFVRALPPRIGPTPSILKRPETPAEKHAIIDQAIARLDTGGYMMAADAYISFWTCGRVPTIRHAVHITHWHVEGDEGVPTYLHFPRNTENSSGEAGGRLGLNAAVVNDDVFFDRATERVGTLPEVMMAMTYLSFFDKVRDEDFGSSREKGSEREQGAAHLAELEGIGRSAGDDPLADKPAPACTTIPPPTYHGTPTADERGAPVPTFRVDEAAYAGHRGASTMIAPLPRNKGSLETDGEAFSARAKVTVTGSPQELRNYDIGFMLTLTDDHTRIRYDGGETVDKGMPVPLRDTDGLQPIEPWYSDGSFDRPRPTQVEVSMRKIVAQEHALRYEDIRGNNQRNLGGPLQSVRRDSQYQLWLVARRRGAALDRFSTHFLSGTRVDFTQNFDVNGQTGSGRFRSDVPISGSDPNSMRFNGPTPESLGPQETTTTDTISSCGASFGTVHFEIDDEDAKSSSGVVQPRRADMEIEGKQVPGLLLEALERPVDYRPTVTMVIRNARKAPDNAFQVGLVQNLTAFDWKNHYDNGTVVDSKCQRALPIRDGDERQENFDRVFMSNKEPELAKLTLLRRQARLKLRDVPGGAAMLNLADNPSCQGKNTGRLTRVTNDSRFRTWVGVRLREDATCMQYLHRIDWRARYEVATNPDRVVRATLQVTESNEHGEPAPSLRGLANNECGSDYRSQCP